MWILSKFLWPVWAAYDILKPEKTGMSADEAKWLADDAAKAKAWSLSMKPATTREQFKATQKAREAFDDKMYSWKESIKITQWDIVDGDNMKVWSKNMKDLKVEDLKKIDDKLVKEVNYWNMWWAVTEKATGVRWASKADDAAWVLSKIKNLKKAPWFVLNIIKKNPKTAVLAAWAAWLTNELMDWAEEQKEEPQVIDSLTGKPAVNSWAADKQAEEVLDTTKKELVESSKDIAEQVKAWEITKDEAREQIWVLKEFASYNFETSIADNLKMKWLDGSYEAREKLAKAMGIEWYQGTYEQNVEMLDKVRYMKADEINSLLGNK